MDYLVTDCHNQCPMYDSNMDCCQHPAYPQEETNFSASDKFCPLRKEPLTLVALFD